MVEDLYELRDDGTIVLAVHAQPGAGRSAIVGRHGTSVKVRVAAPPEGGRANEALARLLADAVGVDRGAVELVSGDHSRSKRFHITGVEPEEFAKRLETAIEEGTAPPGGSGRRHPGR